jgi:hypothetical protein
MPGLDVYGSDVINNAYQVVKNNLDLQNTALDELQSKNVDLLKKQQIQLNQMKEIQDKEKLLITRSRMLQISQDRNSYKKKIIYSLIAAIFVIFIFTLAMYVFYVRKIGMSK